MSGRISVGRWGLAVVLAAGVLLSVTACTVDAFRFAKVVNDCGAPIQVPLCQVVRVVGQAVCVVLQSHRESHRAAWHLGLRLALVSGYFRHFVGVEQTAPGHGGWDAGIQEQRYAVISSGVQREYADVSSSLGQKVVDCR